MTAPADVGLLPSLRTDDAGAMHSSNAAPVSSCDRPIVNQATIGCEIHFPLEISN
jgi:hypothetical protein